MKKIARAEMPKNRNESNDAAATDRLLAKAYVGLRMKDRGVSKGEFMEDPAKHLRKLSMTLSPGKGAGEKESDCLNTTERFDDED